LAVGGWSMGAVKYKVWHEGNDGPTSGLNADLLDGQQGSYYYPASNPNGYTSHPAANDASITLGAGTGINITPNNVFTTNQSANETINISINLNELTTSTTDGDGDYFVVVDTEGSGRKLTKGNIALSGFNDNISSTAASTNTLVKRNASGYIFSNYINTTDDASSALGNLVGKNGSDNYHRTYSAATVRSFLNVDNGANNYSLPLASSSLRGGVKIGYSQNAKNYPVVLSNEQMYVNVPWTDTVYSLQTNNVTNASVSGNTLTLSRENAGDVTFTASEYSLPLASSSLRGGVKIGYAENGKNYPVELSNEQMYVNVPWTDTDTNTTYTANNGVKLTGTVFELDAVTQSVTFDILTATEIRADFIGVNQINATLIAANSITATQLAISSNNDEQSSSMFFNSNGSIRIYDASGTLRVKIGNLA